MKKFIAAGSALVLVFCLTVSAFAQDGKAESELFGKIVKLTQTKKPEDQEKAYNLSKDFLAKYGTGTDDQVKKIKGFVEKYKVAAFMKKLEEVKTAEAFALGKEILAQQPENTFVIINLAYGGYDALDKKKDKSFAADSINYAKQALMLLEAGKLPDSFAPFKDQAEAAALMYYVIGSFTTDSDAREAAKSFYKSLQYESQIKNTSYPYYAIAYGYEKAYEKLADDYQAKINSKSADSELMAAQKKLEKAVALMLDAYARAVKVAETDNNSGKEAWKQRYMEIYKYANHSDAGSAEYLNSVMNKPLPDPNSL